jgi:hypothetical protein
MIPSTFNTKCQRPGKSVAGTDEGRKRWMTDGTYEIEAATDMITSGVLQMVAAQLLNQVTQQSKGRNEIYDGLRLYADWRGEKRQRRAARLKKQK